ncbi:signal peptidase I [Lysinibacillus sp. G4S2]|uniref:signal peptidase I n=1 Tax=Lysinibacillus sp. G4S2 TaxID=3055859 RepID=UPI0025A15194|nr:signal peptidase I [Lysinibacillus sp. G4S2]MDM5249284.1 signal peptidase I [Lysinibacillus sp. G4S2]
MTEKQTRNEFWGWFKAIGLAIILTMGVRYFIVSPVAVQGASMEPTFENGDKVIVNKVGPRISNYDRFDIIVFEAKEDENFIKRIIGLPGDHIAYKDDVLYINGKAYDEPYLTEYKEALRDKGNFTYDFTLEEQLGEMTVPEGHFFVLGDNRRRSIDSRKQEVGFVSQDKILGTAEFVLWPFERLGSTR